MLGFGLRLPVGARDLMLGYHPVSSTFLPPSHAQRLAQRGRRLWVREATLDLGVSV
jgi:hypothetical protein